MAFPGNLPISESLGVFVGVSGFELLSKGQAEPLKAALAALAAGAAIVLLRLLFKQRDKPGS